MLIYIMIFLISPFLTANREADVLFEVLFDEEFPGGLTIRFVFADNNCTLGICSCGQPFYFILLMYLGAV